MIQGSDEWFSARCGKVTASRIDDLMARTKIGYGASRANYMAQLIAERLTGKPTESYTNGAMQWGIDHEAEARAAYEFFREAQVTEVGFLLHPTIVESGASPDGLVGDDGLVEIKCPNTATHIDTLLNLQVPGKYTKQMLWQMASTRRKWCDFVSYDPRMPEKLRLFVKRFEFDAEEVRRMETEVLAFLNELNGKLELLRRLT